MSTFASLVAPFGGFFASGFKRAFKIKDFGDSIPGHGGMTDRMDCQYVLIGELPNLTLILSLRFLMGLFSYVYYSTTIREHHVTVGSILQAIVSGLTIEEQLQLFGDLKRFLEARGVMP
jgi:phosphatidate cytidylyltransferase